MATTEFGLNDPLAVKLWSKSLLMLEREYVEFDALTGNSADSIVQVLSETQKTAGDRIRIALRARLSGDGIGENEVGQGNGESLGFYHDDLYINELGHVTPISQYTISEQRIPYNLRAECRDALAEWWGERMAKTFFNQVCGNTAVTNPKYYGFNTPTAPSANRKIFAGSATTDEGLTSSDTFSLALIDKAVEKIAVHETGTGLRPIRINGSKHFVLYLHPYQVRSLRTNTSTGQWLDIQKAAMTGGDVSRNPIFTGALGVYNGVILRQTQDVCQGINSSSGAVIPTVRRAVLLGAQACCIAYGMMNGSRIRWSEQLDDHKRHLEIGAWKIFGVKKTVMNGEDYGCMTISTYAAAA